MGKAKSAGLSESQVVQLAKSRGLSDAEWSHFEKECWTYQDQQTHQQVVIWAR